jgi:CheY-like chemotaxis protein
MSKILIADDEQEILDLFGNLVESMGHTAIKCHNGKVAWDILTDNHDVSLMLVDVAMPEMDGRELVQRVRGQEILNTIPIVLVSSIIRAKDISHLLEMGGTWFMPKPVDLMELKDVINKNIAAG